MAGRYGGRDCGGGRGVQKARCSHLQMGTGNREDPETDRKWAWLYAHSLSPAKGFLQQGHTSQNLPKQWPPPRDKVFKSLEPMRDTYSNHHILCVFCVPGTAGPCLLRVFSPALLRRQMRAQKGGVSGSAKWVTFEPKSPMSVCTSVSIVALLSPGSITVEETLNPTELVKHSCGRSTPNFRTVGSERKCILWYMIHII